MGRESKGERGGKEMKIKKEKHKENKRRGGK